MKRLVYEKYSDKPSTPGTRTVLSDYRIVYLSSCDHRGVFSSWGGRQSGRLGQNGQSEGWGENSISKKFGGFCFNTRSSSGSWSATTSQRQRLQSLDNIHSQILNRQACSSHNQSNAFKARMIYGTLVVQCTSALTSWWSSPSRLGWGSWSWRWCLCMMIKW